MSLSFDVYAEVKFNPCTNERELSKKLLKKIKDKIVRFSNIFVDI